MQPENQPQEQPTTGWQFNPGQTATTEYGQSPTNNESSQLSSQKQTEANVSWTASEFIAYQKGFGWYAIATIALLIIGGIVYLVTKDYISAIMTALLIAVFIVFASRKPRVLTYEISDQGIIIGEKLVKYSTLKSFSIIDEGAIHSIDILPLKRFMPGISMYYEQRDEAAIVQALGEYLPKEERNQPLIDKFMHKIRF